MLIVAIAEEIVHYGVAPKNPSKHKCYKQLQIWKKLPTGFQTVLTEGKFKECLLFHYYDNYLKIIGHQLLNSLHGPIIN